MNFDGYDLCFGGSGGSVPVVSLVPVVPFRWLRSLRWFRWFRSGGFVPLFPVLPHAENEGWLLGIFPGRKRNLSDGARWAKSVEVLCKKIATRQLNLGTHLYYKKFVFDGGKMYFKNLNMYTILLYTAYTMFTVY